MRLDSVLHGCSWGTSGVAFKAIKLAATKSWGESLAELQVWTIDLVVLSRNPSQGRPAKMSNDSNKRLFRAAAKTRQKLKMSLCIATLQLQKNAGREGSEEGRERLEGGGRERKEEKRKTGKSPYITMM